MSITAILFFVVILLFFGLPPIIKRIRNTRSDISPGQEKILIEKLEFYRDYSPALKDRFRRRMAQFIGYHEFEGRQGFEVTEEMKVLIAAAAVRITLGLNDFVFNAFPRIVLYPDIYFSKLTHSWNKGETTQAGMIIFSWPHYEDGFADEHDKINLGYHEFAHALVIQHVYHGINDTDFVYGFESISDALENDKLSQRVSELDFLREYAFHNKMEFIAVAIEYFFESPKEMKRKCIELYQLIANMLCQDINPGPEAS